MKRLFYVVAAVIVILAVSCKKDSKGTPSVETLDATEVGASTACLNARIDFAGIRWSSFGGINYGFYWGTSADALDEQIYASNILNEGDSDFYATLSDLSPHTQYWYKAYMELDGEPYSGEVKSFTTL